MEMDVHSARRSLSQTAVLEAMRRNVKNPSDTWTDWKTVYGYCLELADPAVDVRTWADDHTEHSEDSHRWGMLTPSAMDALRYSLTSWRHADLLDDRLFLEHGAPLGPLAGLTVYSTDFSAWDVPEVSEGASFLYYSGTKAHAPGYCQYSREITAGFAHGYSDDALTYADFMIRMAALRTFQRNYVGFRSDVCSKCGGVTMRLLSDEQLLHLEQVRAEVDEARQAGVVQSLRP